MKFKDTGLILLASCLFSVSFAPLSLWFAAPIVYAIFLKVLLSNQHNIRNSFLFGFLANAIILSWSKTFVGVTPWILLALLQGLYLIPVGILSRYVKQPAVLAAAILIMDEVKNYFPFGGFGWSRIAYSQVDSPFLNLVSIFGVISLSLTTLTVSLLILRPRLMNFAIVIATLLIASVPLQNLGSGKSLQIRAVQGGVPERGLEFNARAQAVLDNHIDRTLEDFDREDDLILWPENAIDVDPIRNALVSDKLKSLQSVTKVPLLAGAILDEKELLNTALLFDIEGRPQSTYVKRYLTPFGEYIPIRSIASLVSPHTDRVTDFTPGTEFVVHQVSGVQVSTIICYEILSDSIFRESANSSGIITVLTNSATFAGSAEGNQQMNITRIRAVETGKNIVSVSTTGPSAFLNHRGEVLSKLDDGQEGSVSSVVGVRDGATLAVQYGGIFSIFVILLSIVSIVYAVFRRGRRL